MMAVDFISTMDILKPLVFRVRPWQVEAHYEMGAPARYWCVSNSHTKSAKYLV